VGVKKNLTVTIARIAFIRYNSYRGRESVARDGAWCNGSTPDFGSVDLGSTPGAPA
jgi:hypothetical protein